MFMKQNFRRATVISAFSSARAAKRAFNHYRLVCKNKWFTSRGQSSIISEQEPDLNLLRAHWDEPVYRRLNPSAAQALCQGVYSDGLAHWWSQKDDECIRLLPPASWNESGYLQLHPDVSHKEERDTITRGYEHWLRHGAWEHRALPNSTSSPKTVTYPLTLSRAHTVEQNWNEEAYLNLHPDVASGVSEGLFFSGLSHWRDHGGRLQQREIVHAPWDETGYLNLHADVKAAVERGDLTSGHAHYNASGEDERRILPDSSQPEWLTREMQHLACIEPLLFPPTPSDWAHTGFFDPSVHQQAGRQLKKLFSLTDGPIFTHVFILPFLHYSGADIAALHHVNVLATEFKKQILVLTTDDVCSTWTERLEPSVTHVDFYSIFKHQTDYQSKMALIRLLLKLKPKTIHAINSLLFWKCLKQHGRALSSASHIFCSLYNFQHSLEGKETGYPLLLEQTWPFLSGIFTDHARFAERLASIYGIDPRLFSVARFPTYAKRKRRPLQTTVVTNRRVLWASRLVPEKRPNLLVEVAQLLPDFKFDVYGSCEHNFGDEHNQTLKALTETPNIELFGKFDGFDTIPSELYNIFLYTTRSDGLPNILLESMAAGLSVIAPDVGGIRELFERDNPMFLQVDPTAATAAQAVSWAFEHPEEAMVISARQTAAMLGRHNKKMFAKTLRDVPHYGVL